MQHQNDESSQPLSHATGIVSSYLTNESNNMHLSRFKKDHHHSNFSTTNSEGDEMDIDKCDYVGAVNDNNFEMNSARSIYSDNSNQSATASITPTKRTPSSSSTRRSFLQRKASNASLSNSPMFNRTPLKSLTNFPLNVKEKTKAFTKSMTEVVSKSSHSLFANLHMTPKVTDCHSTYDDEYEDEEGQATDCDSGNYNDGIGREGEAEDEDEDEEEEEDSDDEGEATFDTINLDSPVMHRKTNSIQINKQEESDDHKTQLRSPTRTVFAPAAQPPTTSRPKIIRRIHSVCETQREIDSFQLHEDNSQLKNTNIQTFTSGNDVLPRINEDQMYKILCGEHNHEFDEFIIVDCRFDYEYHGGHIINALNISTKEALENLFINQDHNTHDRIAKTARASSSSSNKKKLVIFHCEFSIFRGPTMAKHLRKCDRTLNQNSYPFLSWPDVVVLEGGYKNFFTKYKSFCCPQNYVEMKDIKHEVSCEANLSRVRKDSKLLTRAKSFNQFGGGERHHHYHHHHQSHHHQSHHLHHNYTSPKPLTSASISDFWSMSHSRSLSSSNSNANSFATLNSGKVIKRQRSNSKVKSLSTNLNTKLTRANTFTFDQPIFNSGNAHHPSSSLSPSSSPLFDNFDFNEEVDKENPSHLQQHHHQPHQPQHQLRSFLPPSTSFRNPHQQHQQQQHQKAQSSSSLSSLPSYRHGHSYSSNFSNFSSSSISIHSSASSIVSENITSSTDSLNEPYSGSGMTSPFNEPSATVAGSGASSLSLASDYFDSKRVSSTSLPAVPPSLLRPVSRKPSALQTSLAALAPAPQTIENDTAATSQTSPSKSPFLRPRSSFQFPPRQKKSMSTTNVPISTTSASPTIPSPLTGTSTTSSSRRAAKAGEIDGKSTTSLASSTASELDTTLEIESTSATSPIPNYWSTSAKSNMVSSSSTSFSSLIDDPINDTPVDFNVPVHRNGGSGGAFGAGHKKHHYHQLANRPSLHTWPSHTRTSSNSNSNSNSYSYSNNSSSSTVLGLSHDPSGAGGSCNANAYSVDDINEDDEEDL
ncbi:MIH1 [Candida margitis]|uniref:MIH1 n=1 Tax=Candida margitis TaxID=1775924 RepID=UPI00222728BF|nr:MIH1 [Candida margitis]KAI5967352.1 MIH1 [Candida margitis]